MKRPAGSGSVTKNGYVLHTFGSWGTYRGKKYSGVRLFEHHLVAEKVLGRKLKGEEEVHHWNEIKTDNRPENLVICPNRAYHILLHQRARSYDACGHASWLKCPRCKQYGDPKTMKFRPRGIRRPNQFQWAHSGGCP